MGSWRQPPPRFPRRSVAAGTGTTGSVGFATPPSPSSPSCGAASTRRPWRGETGCFERRPAIPPRCRSCTAPPASAGWTSGRSTGSPATRISPVRIGNAAAGQFQLDVYGEVMSALYESAQASEFTESPAWEFQLALMDFLRRAGGSPTTGSGRYGGRGATSPTRRSWPGWPSTAPSRRPRTTTSRDRSTVGSDPQRDP